jgi:two-component system sensor histidine kinase DesK
VTWVWVSIIAVLLGAIAIGGILQVTAYQQLGRARRELARLAMAEERLRIARDLHDVLGQRLAAMALRGEVAAHGLPPDTEPSLRREVMELAEMARAALGDLRSTALDDGRPVLAAELEGAEHALRAAGIELVVEGAGLDLSPEQDGVLAWAVREAVTNVLRHSGATRCWVTIRRDAGAGAGGVELEVGDDGSGAAVVPGTGLRAMRERVEELNGRLTAGGDGSGFTVLVRLPDQDPSSSPRRPS